MSNLSAKVREEIAALIPPTIFFFITLNLVALVRTLMVEGTGLPVSTPMQVALGALILGKAVLLADLLPAINRFPARPLIYNVLWKSVIYFVVASVLHYLERLIDFWKEDGSFAAANEALLAQIVWPHFWAIQLILAVLILNYCVLHELVRRVGANNARELFFGSTARAAD